ncbi:MAG: YdeI/OmpD-associated family protein [Bryobacterales bacterium]|nr:YdeI/OmpD-associated family protein [Bryobacterales bacterium]
MPGVTGHDEVYAESREAWRQWLLTNHAKRASVWLVYYKKDSGIPSVRYSEAVEEALCFGWIDSRVQSIDEKRYRQHFTVRKPRSVWSGINKGRVEKLRAQGLIMPAGLRAIETAKANGSWESLNAAEALEMPPDLIAALDSVPGARRNFDAWSQSQRQILLQWIASAKRAETRVRRIAETAESAGRNVRPGPLAYLQRGNDANKR